MPRSKPGFPDGLGDAVFLKLRGWVVGYESGSPVNPRGVAIPDRGPDELVRVCDAYKHNISFRLNQLTYLEQMLDYITQDLPEMDPKRVVYNSIKKAREQHEKLQDSKRIAVGVEYAQSYALQKSHVQWIYSMVQQHKLRQITIAVDPKKAVEDIKEGNW
jgi:hypothetical protein